MHDEEILLMALYVQFIPQNISVGGELGRKEPAQKNGVVPLSQSYLIFLCSYTNCPCIVGHIYIYYIQYMYMIPVLLDEPDAFPPEFWHLFLQSSLTALIGGKMPAGLRGHDMEVVHHRGGYMRQ